MYLRSSKIINLFRNLCDIYRICKRQKFFTLFYLLRHPIVKGKNQKYQKTTFVFADVQRLNKKLKGCALKSIGILFPLNRAMQ
jgi:hypothetical protein